MKLTAKVFLQIFLSVMTVVLPVVGLQVYEKYQDSRTGFLNENVKLIDAFRWPLAEALWNFDLNFTKQIVMSLIMANHVDLVQVYDEELKPYFGLQKEEGTRLREVSIPTDHRVQQLAERIQSSEYTPYELLTDPQDRRSYVLVLPIFLKSNEEQPLVKSMNVINHLHGLLYVKFNTEIIDHELMNSIFQAAVTILLVIMALNLVIYLFFNSSVLEPIRKISKFVENVHEKRDQRLDLHEYDTREFKKLSQTLNQMMDFLNARDDLIMNQQKQMIYASKMSALGEMSSGIAHEINNPLSVIMGYTYVLKDKIQKSKVTQEEIINQLSKIQEITDQIAKIIKGMNSFARNSSQDPMVPVSISHLMENALELCSQRFKNHQIQLQVAPIPPVSLFGRESQLAQVLLNLLNNAYDAVLKTAPAAWVEVRFEYDDQGLRILVTDSGTGISANLAERIMEPFFTTKEVGQGVGLGLSIAKNIIQEHGGDLSFNSQSPNTQFVISFPPRCLVQPEPGLGV